MKYSATNILEITHVFDGIIEHHFASLFEYI